jgi:hypothetical protein
MISYLWKRAQQRTEASFHIHAISAPQSIKQANKASEANGLQAISGIISSKPAPSNF